MQNKRNYILIVLFFIGVNLYSTSYIINYHDKNYKLDFSDKIEINSHNSSEMDFILYITKYSYDEFIDIDKKTSIYASQVVIEEKENLSFKKFQEWLKNRIPISDSPGTYNILDFYSYDNFCIFEWYRLPTFYRGCNNFGSYLTFLVLENEIYLFWFTPNKNTSEFYKELLPYIEEVDIRIYDYEKNLGFLWKNSNSDKRFAQDVYYKKEILPQYVKDFNDLHKESLQMIIECFDNDKTTENLTLRNNIDLLQKQKSTTNLRIRESAINGKSIVTIQEGENVFVITDGVEDTIDGIKGKWVKVVVSKGSKDKDGKIIEKDLLGWCFDGYLE